MKRRSFFVALAVLGAVLGIKTALPVPLAAAPMFPRLVTLRGGPLNGANLSVDGPGLWIEQAVASGPNSFHVHRYMWADNTFSEAFHAGVVMGYVNGRSWHANT